jgi:CubicO group peptidase (beta-lactamase class C family)
MHRADQDNPQGRRDLLRGIAAVGAIVLAAGCADGGRNHGSAGDEGGMPKAGGPVFDAAGAAFSGLARPAGPFPRADRASWWRPIHAIDGFSRLDEILDANIVRRSPRPSTWTRPALEPAIAYDGAARMGGGRFDLDQYLARNPTTALAIVRGDTLLVERYRYGRRDTQRMTSFSMAKTLVAMLVGVALADGLIGSIDDPAERYVAGLAGSAYGRTPLRHLLTMSSGVDFREDYSGNDDVARLSRATIGGVLAGASAARQFDERGAAPGARWNYASAETYVLALVLRAAIGRSIADYMSEKIWRPMGAEADATWLVEATGIEVGYMGFNAVLRDYARLGRLLAEGGRAEGRQLVPEAWIREMTRAHIPGAATGRWYGYGYQTWVFPANDGSFALLGVRGQTLFVDPARRLVLVHLAVRPDARDPGGADTTALWQGVKTSLAR